MKAKVRLMPLGCAGVSMMNEITFLYGVDSANLSNRAIVDHDFYPPTDAMMTVLFPRCSGLDYLDAP